MSIAEKTQVVAGSGTIPDSEKGFVVLLQMASNPEVLGHILRGLYSHIPMLLKLLQQRNDSTLHRNMATLLHKLLKVSLAFIWLLTTLIHSVRYYT